MSNDDILDENGQALFRSKVDALNWLAVQTRPDIAYEVMELSTCFKKATVRKLKEVNKCIKMVKSEKVNVVYPKLGHVAGWNMSEFEAIVAAVYLVFFINRSIVLYSITEGISKMHQLERE